MPFLRYWCPGYWGFLVQIYVGLFTGCVDRTIFCNEPPSPERAKIEFAEQPNPASIRELDTVIQYSCPNLKHYFDYPVGNNFVSYFYTTNINSINITCNHDG